jgi:ubiquinone/menaquinone biosynthesis C-methylase UbiE
MSVEQNKFQDYFSKQSAIYAKARPGYPKELFSYLASLSPMQEIVWDCATGNGQAAISLAEYFKKVIATDASKEQLKIAQQHVGVEYRIALAEESGLEDNSINLITVANAIHWFNLEKFFSEVKRVLKPGGIIAAWTYARSGVNEAVDKVMDKLAKEILLDYWPAGSVLARAGYKDLNLPFESINVPAFKYKTQVDLDKLMGFAYSWSSTQLYIGKHGKDPVEMVKPQLSNAWGNPNEKKEMTWELALKAGRK